MKKLSIALLMSCQLTLVNANEIHQPALIYEAVEKHVNVELSRAPSALNDIKTHIGTIDSRVRLQACERPLNTITEFGNIQQKHLTIKVSCDAPVKWSLRVPVKLQIFQPVVIAAMPIPRDQVISANDIQIHKQDVNQLNDGYFQTEEEIIGLSTVKTIQPGAVIKRHMVRQPIAIRRGETVKIVIISPGFTLEADGVAQADGAIGDTIRVKNSRSNKMIDAKVKSSGTVCI
ncbi:MAG: flagellar basal body P-ring formation chaperone FlgA [Candidatus Berkiella sp.]